MPNWLDTVFEKFQQGLDSFGDIRDVVNQHSPVQQNVAGDAAGTPVGNLLQGLYQILNDPQYSGSGLVNPDVIRQVMQQISAAFQQGDYRTIQGLLGSLPSAIRVDPEITKYLDNMISQQGTLETRQWEEEQASSNLLKAGNQLEQLGLSTSGVLQTGGSNVNAAGSPSNSMTNFGQQMKMARYNQKMAMARQILSMTSQMASAGIYGSAIGAAKHAAGVVTSNAAHSAYGALSGIGHSRIRNEKPTMTRDQILKALEIPEESQY